MASSDIIGRMQSHPDWNLRLHTDEELEGLLGEPLSGREPLHSWPLSSVERLTLRSGRRGIYKVQHEPTVEPELLALATAPFLPTCTVLQRDSEQAALLLPYLTAPTLKDRVLSANEQVAVGQELIAQFHALPPNLPVYRDLGSLETWQGFVEETLGLVRAMIASGKFTATTHDDLTWLERWSERPDVHTVIATTSQLIHGDLKAEHVFCHTDGSVTVIDWQRPYRAPAEIDLVLLLESLGLDPAPHVAPAVVCLRWFLLLHWASEAQANLLPELPFFERWVQQALGEMRRGLAAISC